MKKLHILFLSILPALVILFCFLGFLAAPNDPEEVVITQSFLAPCAEYPLGTDQYGRCVLSRILYGGYTTLGIVLMGSAIVMTVGILLGLLLGQGKAGRNVLFESILNAVTAIPPIAYLIIFISTWGNSVSTMVVALTVSLILRMIKLVKTKTELEYNKAYVLCAVASGASRFRILLVHILPNLIRDAFRFSCLSAGEMILSISGFSFIGLSLGEGVIDWGTAMLSPPFGGSEKCLFWGKRWSLCRLDTPG